LPQPARATKETRQSASISPQNHTFSTYTIRIQIVCLKQHRFRQKRNCASSPFSWDTELFIQCTTPFTFPPFQASFSLFFFLSDGFYNAQICFFALFSLFLMGALLLIQRYSFFISFSFFYFSWVAAAPASKHIYVIFLIFPCF
jgi:hypothetical protein